MEPRPVPGAGGTVSPRFWWVSAAWAHFTTLPSFNVTPTSLAAVMPAVKSQSCLAARPREFVWTSGATEAINLAMKGAALARGNRGAHIVAAALERKAVLDTAAWFESQGFDVDRTWRRRNGRCRKPCRDLATERRPLIADARQ